MHKTLGGWRSQLPAAHFLCARRPLIAARLERWTLISRVGSSFLPLAPPLLPTRPPDVQIQPTQTPHDRLDLLDRRADTGEVVEMSSSRARLGFLDARCFVTTDNVCGLTALITWCELCYSCRLNIEKNIATCHSPLFAAGCQGHRWPRETRAPAPLQVKGRRCDVR